MSQYVLIYWNVDLVYSVCNPIYVHMYLGALGPRALEYIWKYIGLYTKYTKYIFQYIETFSVRATIKKIVFPRKKNLTVSGDCFPQPGLRGGGPFLNRFLPLKRQRKTQRTESNSYRNVGKKLLWTVLGLALNKNYRTPGKGAVSGQDTYKMRH